ncbi:MAG TPA: DNA polymerase III subunit epsilon, partial [Alcanivorax sp.]|nr:DNA polymerase III subunit epsilon [Alcanivorax sp.]
QTKLSLGGADAGEQGSEQAEAIRRLAADRPRLAVVRASDTDLERHRKKLEAMAESRGQMTLWQELEQ